MHLRFVTVPDDADEAGIDRAIRLLVARKSGALIPSTKLEIQADIDELLERRLLLTVTA